MHKNHKMEVIDISMTLSRGIATYPGDPKVSIEPVKDYSNEGVVVSKITMGLHSGTHVDAPKHYLKGGASLDEVGLQSLIGRARVCDLSFVTDAIKESDLAGCGIRKEEIVLLRTKNEKLSGKRFSKAFVHLSNGGADYLVEKGVKAVGIDYLSIEAYGSKDHYIHRALLSNNILIIEGLALGGVKPGIYDFVCLPLKIAGGEAAPARCILFG